MHICIKSLKFYTYMHCTIFFLCGVQDLHIQRSVAIPKPWLVTNLTIYGTPSICAIIFSIGDGVESAKVRFLAKFHAQFVCLVAWQVL